MQSLLSRDSVKVVLVVNAGSRRGQDALASSEVYGLGGVDLTAIVNTARRRHRSVWATLDELERQPGILRVSPATRGAVHRLVEDVTRYTAMAHDRPAGDRKLHLQAR